jgi:hypothetical protein
VNMHRAGIRLVVEVGAYLVHAYRGWSFVFDVRRNKGFQAASISSNGKPDHSLRLAYLGVRRCFSDDLQSVRRSARYFLKWRDWPLLILMMIVLRIPEFIGARYAGDPDLFQARTSYS